MCPRPRYGIFYRKVSIAESFLHLDSDSRWNQLKKLRRIDDCIDRCWGYWTAGCALPDLNGDILAPADWLVDECQGIEDTDCADQVKGTEREFS